MAILICGGAGYIGSHTVADLLNHGEEIIVADNLSRGHPKAVLGGTLCEGDLRDKSFLRSVFRDHSISAVVHFAADSQVGESMKEPLKYYDNNLGGGISLLECMREFHVDRIVFSSTAATYGDPCSIPIKEDDPTIPTNPYGETKLSFEKCLKWAQEAYGIRHVILRYFNAAGAHTRVEIGEDHAQESHLIPIILQVALGQRSEAQIYGEDYPTPDKTCIRDYIHVEDLAQAHVLALNHLATGNAGGIFNLGNGSGFSVRQVIETARRVTGHSIPVRVGPRRPGDPPSLVASSQRAREVLGWKPKYPDLESIVRTAWEWHRKHPKGFEDKL